MAELAVRLVVSLAAVVGLLLLLTKWGSRRFRGSAGQLIQVVHRQSLSRTSSISVVTVAGRVLVLGSTEQNMQVLAELDPEELADSLALTAPAGTAETKPSAAGHRAPASTGFGGINGSILSARTWRQAFSAVGRTP